MSALMMGQYKGTSANVISLNAYNVPQGSVVVTAGGVTLQEGSDYSVDYSAGEVTILNQSILDAGTNVNVSLESNTDYGMQRKTMLGVNWEYDFSKNFQLGGTLMHLSEQALTSKVSMGSEPIVTFEVSACSERCINVPPSWKFFEKSYSQFTPSMVLRCMP